jgi:hypothetical protein
MPNVIADIEQDVKSVTTGDIKLGNTKIPKIALVGLVIVLLVLYFVVIRKKKDLGFSATDQTRETGANDSLANTLSSAVNGSQEPTTTSNLSDILGNLPQPPAPLTQDTSAISYPQLGDFSIPSFDPNQFSIPNFDTGISLPDLSGYLGSSVPNLESYIPQIQPVQPTYKQPYTSQGLFTPITKPFVNVINTAKAKIISNPNQVRGAVERYYTKNPSVVNTILNRILYPTNTSTGTKPISYTPPKPVYKPTTILPKTGTSIFDKLNPFKGNTGYIAPKYTPSYNPVSSYTSKYTGNTGFVSPVQIKPAPIYKPSLPAPKVTPYSFGSKYTFY